MYLLSMVRSFHDERDLVNLIIIPLGAVSITTSSPAVSQQQSILGSIDNLVSAFSALASEAQANGS
jgi:hypothetical protein